MKHLKRLEEQSIFLLREAYSQIPNLCMLWSIGKDSTVLLWLARKAFLGRVPFPLVHIDTTFKIPEMIQYRDKLALDWSLDLVVGRNDEALKTKNTFPDGKLSRTDCCRVLKTEALRKTISAEGPRYRLNHQSGTFALDTSTTQYRGVILGIRSDEEGSRSKERYFSPRDVDNKWHLAQQPPEFWSQYATEFPPNTHVRIHPLLDWTEINIWEYIVANSIPTVSLYYNHGDGKRYRSLGCYPCTTPVQSNARTPQEIVEELRTGQFANVAERSGRAQDSEDGGGLETLRRGGYM